MEGGKLLRSHNPKAGPKEKVFSKSSPPEKDGKVSDKEAASEPMSDGKLFRLMISMTEDLKDFKKDIKSAISELKGELKADLREELTTFKRDLNLKLTELSTSIQTQGQAISEMQDRVSELEENSVINKESLLFLLNERRRLQDKVTDLESRSRRCNIRIYGVPEDTEGDSMFEYLDQLLNGELAFPDGMALQIQRAHRASPQKPGPGSPPRSIVVCFQQFKVKDVVLGLAWKKKIYVAGNLISFDHDYAPEVVEKRRAYAGVKKALKEKSIRFQTPFTKIRVHWANGTETYKDAQEAIAELRARGIGVPKQREDTGSSLEGNLKNTSQWQRETTRGKGDIEARTREKLQEFRRTSQQFQD